MNTERPLQPRVRRLSPRLGATSSAAAGHQLLCRRRHYSAFSARSREGVHGRVLGNVGGWRVR